MGSTNSNTWLNSLGIPFDLYPLGLPYTSRPLVTTFPCVVGQRAPFSLFSVVSQALSSLSCAVSRHRCLDLRWALCLRLAFCVVLRSRAHICIGPYAHSTPTLRVGTADPTPSAVQRPKEGRESRKPQRKGSVATVVFSAHFGARSPYLALFHAALVVPCHPFVDASRYGVQQRAVTAGQRSRENGAWSLCVPFYLLQMAKKKEGSSKEVVSREYTINLHKRIHKTSFKERAPKAIKEIRAFAKKVMGTKDVRLDVKLNKAVWMQGIKNVPVRLRVVIARRRNDDEDAKVSHSRERGQEFHRKQGQSGVRHTHLEAGCAATLTQPLESSTARSAFQLRLADSV